MPNVLEMQIVSDISSLEKGLKQAEKLQAEYTSKIEDTNKELAQNIIVSNGYKKAVSDLSAEFKKGAISQKEYEKGLENLKRDEQETSIATQNLRKDLATLKKEQKELGGTFDTAAKKTANGGNALMQFSRIAQDAPFGIQGIGNNITATVEAFGHLQKSAGGTGAALKAVAGSMLGSGGILLAVSLVTTALTYMSQNGLTVQDVFDQLTGTFDENAKAMKDIAVESAKTAGEEIANVKAYVSVASNRNLSDKERLAAVKKLQDEYPAYFGNLSQEAILNGNVAGAVKEVTIALRNRALAQAYAGKAGELASKEVELRDEEARLIQKSKDALKDYNKAKQDLNKGDNRAVMDVANAQFAEAQRELKGVQAEILNTISAIDKYQQKQNEFKAKSIALEITPPKTTKADAIDVTPKVTALPKLETTAEIAEKYLKEFQKVFGNVLKNKIEPIELNIPPVVIPAVDDSEYRASLERAMQAADIFSNASSASIESLAGSITSSLQTGNAALDAFTGSVIQSLADIAKAQLAGLIEKQALATTSLATDAAVSTGNAVTAATETAAASGPAAAFILPALVGAAIGFIAASFAGIKFAHGGIVPGGSYTGDKIPAMLNSGEAVLNSQQQSNMLMAVANGNANSLQGNRQNSTFNLESKVIGKDLLLLLKRAEKER